MSTAKLYNIGYISSATGGKISGAQFIGNWQGQIITDGYIADNLTLTDITQVTNRSHTALSDIGSNTHATLDKIVISAQVASASSQLAIYEVGTPSAHKDTHDPSDGSDPLDTAVAGEIIGVVAAGVGTSHSFARSDHTHQIQHGIADNHIVTIDHVTPVANDYAQFTANGLAGREYSEVRSDLGLVIGTNVQAFNSQYDNWLASGEKLSRWFKESSMKLGEVGASGEKWYKAYKSGQLALPDAAVVGTGLINKTASMTYSTVTDSSTNWNTTYTWYNNNNAQFANWLASGEKLSRWFKESSTAISLNFYNSGEKTWDAWKWYSTSSNQFGNWLISGEKLSRWYKESSQMLGSGVKWSNAYKSGQLALPDAALSDGLVKRTASMTYTAVTDNSTNWDTTYTWYNTNNAQLSNWLASGEKLSRWYKESSMKIAEAIFNSGAQNWDTWKWYNTSSNQFSNWLSSGEKLSRWHKESSMKLGEIGFSGEKYTAAYQHSNNRLVHPSAATNAMSGMVATYWGALGGWINAYPPMTYGLANTYLSAQQAIDLARFDCGSNGIDRPKRVYVWQAHCCDSSQVMRGAFAVQVLSGTTIVYSNSSATLSQGYPLVVTNGGKTTLRFAYSSNADGDINGAIYGSCGIQISVI